MSKKFLKLLKTPILIGLLAVATNSHAILVSGADVSTKIVHVSVTEWNRISVADGRSIVSATPMKEDIVTTSKSEDGSVYVAFKRADLGTVTLFVTDDQGAVHKIILNPTASTAEDVVLRASGSSLRNQTKGKAPSYQRRIKNLILTMTEESNNADSDVVKLNNEIPLWAEARLVLLTKQTDGEFVGERYQITNVSKEDMTLSEEEFFRPGINAVSIENQMLPPGESSFIYVVRGRNENE